MRTLPAPPCTRCGSTNTYADAIEMPTPCDDLAGGVPVIPGTIHCRRCEVADQTEEAESAAMRLAGALGLSDDDQLDLIARLMHNTTAVRSYISVSPVEARWLIEWLRRVQPSVTCDRAAIVAETLRFLAGWLVTEDEEHEQSKYLMQTAADIDHAAKWPWSESGCCPLCEEMICDTGCPLSPLRAPPPSP